MRAMIRIGMAEWFEYLDTGNDPIVRARTELRLALQYLGDMHFTWRAGVIDFGGARIIECDPRIGIPFGTMFFECHGEAMSWTQSDA